MRHIFSSWATCLHNLKWILKKQERYSVDSIPAVDGRAGERTETETNTPIHFNFKKLVLK